MNIWESIGRLFESEDDEDDLSSRIAGVKAPKPYDAGERPERQKRADAIRQRAQATAGGTRKLKREPIGDPGAVVSGILQKAGPTGTTYGDIMRGLHAALKPGETYNERQLMSTLDGYRRRMGFDLRGFLSQNAELVDNRWRLRSQPKTESVTKSKRLRFNDLDPGIARQFLDKVIKNPELARTAPDIERWSFEKEPDGTIWAYRGDEENAWIFWSPEEKAWGDETHVFESAWVQLEARLDIGQFTKSKVPPMEYDPKKMGSTDDTWTKVDKATGKPKGTKGGDFTYKQAEEEFPDAFSEGTPFSGHEEEMIYRLSKEGTDLHAETQDSKKEWIWHDAENEKYWGVVR